MSEEKVEEEHFPSKRLDIELPTNGGTSWALIGASRSGKTTLMKFLYKNYFASHITTMFSQNLHADIYKDLSSKVIVADEYYPELIEEAHHINAETNNKFPFLFINDDMVSLKIKNDPWVLKLLTICRNAGMSSIQSFQGRVLMNACGRGQINYVAIFKQQTAKEWYNVIREYLDGWIPEGMTMNEKIKWCMVATQNHQFIFIDNIKNECYISRLFKDQLE